MDSDHMRTAIREITLGITYKDSSIPKNEVNKKGWESLEKEIAEAVNKGYIIEIPAEFD